jgi:hypothetical protein
MREDDFMDEEILSEDEGPVCSLCEKLLEPWELEAWEEEARGGPPMCSYHAHQLDKGD